MKSAVTLQDVANAAGVSKATVSNVFSRPERVRPQLRARVEAAAREIGYAGPDPKGRLLSSGKVNAIGVVPPAAGMSWVFAEPYMREFLTGVTEICEANGAGLSLVSGSDERGAWGIGSAVVDGLIVSTIDQANFIESTMHGKLPFVVMDVDTGAGISSVRIDEREAGRLLTRHLLALGHRRFAIASVARLDMAPVLHMPEEDGPKLVAAYPSDRERFAGVAGALSEAGLSLGAIPVVEACGSEEEQRKYGGGAQLLLDNAAGATAIIALSAPLALSVLAEARRRGIRVPEDLSVGGFDDPPEAATAIPPLTTIAQPAREKGRAAARLLFAGGAAQQLVLPVELKVRSSTGPAPN